MLLRPGVTGYGGQIEVTLRSISRQAFALSFQSMTPCPVTGACTFYTELDVDDGCSFEEAVVARDRRLKELEEDGADARQLGRVRSHNIHRPRDLVQPHLVLA